MEARILGHEEAEPTFLRKVLIEESRYGSKSSSASVWLSPTAASVKPFPTSRITGKG